MAKKKGKKSPQTISKSPEQKQIAAPPPKKDYFITVLLAGIAFISGCLVMVIELTSSRLLAPYWGNTLYCWTGVIGTILFALSLGYLVGGILADRYEKNSLLLVLLAISCLTIASIPFTASLFSSSFAAYDSIVFGPIVGSLLVFALPAFALSTIPPLCVKIISQNLQLVGMASGLVSSISALGSIIGTFLTGFYLIPSFNLATIYYLSAVVMLLLLGIVFISHKKIAKIEAVFLGLLLSVGLLGAWQPYQTVSVFPNNRQIYQQLTPYHLIRVYDEKLYYKLTLDNTPEGAISKSGNELVFEYTKYWQLVKCFFASDSLRKACFVGGGAFAMPIMFHREFDEAMVDVVEIDPALAPVARRFFHLPRADNLRIHTADGRRWFRGKQKHYDFIFVDAFHGVRNIPAHLVTKEYFGELSQALSERGVLAINLISAREEGSLYRSLVKTLSLHFKRIFVFSVREESQGASTNLILYCCKEEYPREKMMKQAEVWQISHLAKHLINVLDRATIAEWQAETFSDEYAPVEYMVAQDQ